MKTIRNANYWTRVTSLEQLTQLTFNKGILGLLGLLLIMSGCQKVEEQIQTTSQNENVTAAATTLGLQVVAEGLEGPITLVEAPDDTKRLFIVEQSGKILILDSTGKQLPDAFIDISSKMVSLNPGGDERGLLGLAFDPNYKVNRRFFVFYTAPPRSGGPEPGVRWDHTIHVSQFAASSSDPNRADIGTEKVILRVNHPQANHVGGTLAFGPDGYLYIAIGDGGNRNDVGPGHVVDWYKVNEGGNGQDICSNLLGNILRIDVSSGTGYTIPADNPFITTPSSAKGEIYAYGFRNPYSFSFDQGGSHQLFSGDAGQSLYEEINLVNKGGNYGWNVKEGTHCFSTANNLVELGSCPIEDNFGITLTDPVIEVPNASNPKGGIASTIIGGHVYRGSSIPELQGKYVFGIFSQGGNGGADGKLFVSTPGGTGLWAYANLPLKDHPENIGQFVRGFGQDLDGEIYVLVTNTTPGLSGKVLKLAMVP